MHRIKAGLILFVLLIHVQLILEIGFEGGLSEDFCFLARRPLLELVEHAH